MVSFKTRVSVIRDYRSYNGPIYLEFGLLADKFSLEYGSICIICFVTIHNFFSYFFSIVLYVLIIDPK
jgi:hypothetical protein